MAKNHCNRKVQRGFTMIEVLIAVLILAIGLLGVAGVQLVSMQQTANSTLRSEATMYAQSLADRVRSNGGLNLTATEIADLKKQVKAGLGPGADVAISGTGRNPSSFPGPITTRCTLLSFSDLHAYCSPQTTRRRWAGGTWRVLQRRSK